MPQLASGRRGICLESGLENSHLSFTLGGCTPTRSSPTPRFPTEIHSGLLEVISPSPHFYPDFSRLRESFGDPKERVRYLYSALKRLSVFGHHHCLLGGPCVMGGVGRGQGGSYLPQWPLCGRPLEVELPLPLRLLLLAHRWRTKQNLDYCFLMMYSQSKGIYYVQVSLKLFSYLL